MGRLAAFNLLIMALVMPSMSVAESDTSTQLLDNDVVEVIRLSYPPGTQSGMHSHQHPHRVVYVEQGGTLELVPEDDKLSPQTVSLTPGTALFLPGTTHNVRNVGATTVVLVEVEIKDQR